MSGKTTQAEAFAEFERRGWEDRTVCAAYDANLGAVTTQCIAALLAAARVERGAHVLDVATGPGYVAAAAAARGTQVSGVDFSATQLAHARARQPAVDFREASADALPFQDACFDAVVCNFGMPHFPDPQAALREACRVLVAGGRLAFSVWDAPDRAVGFGAVYAAVREHGVLHVGLPAGPNFFLFSDPAHCMRAVTQSGFVDVSIAIVPQVWRVHDPDALFDAILDGTVRAAATLRAQRPEALAAIRAAVCHRLEAFRTSEGYDVPMPARVVAGTKPG
jgi:SAM-dependent methyltransferase